MHKRKKLALSATALGVLAASAIAWGVDKPGPQASSTSQPGMFGKHWGPGHGGPMGRMARHLDLTAEQQQAITAILMNAREEGELLRLQLDDLRSQVGDMIRSDQYDEDEVRILVENQSPAFVDLTLLGIRTMSRVYAELTPEQRAKADRMLEQRRGGRFGRGGFGMPGF